jgi:hypothetical protein
VSDPIDPVISVRASYVRLAATCMARMDIRYYLCGIRVEPRTEGGAFIVGTDGHRLMAIIDSTAICTRPAIVKPDARTLSMLPTVDGKGDTEEARLSLTSFRDKPALLVTDKLGLPLHVQVANAEIEGGKFPRWRTVLPVFDKLAPVIADPFSLAYAADMLMGFAPRSRMTSVTMLQAGKHSGIALHFEGYDNALGIVMPRYQEKGTAKWLKTWGPLREEKPKKEAPMPALPATGIEAKTQEAAA